MLVTLSGFTVTVRLTMESQPRLVFRLAVYNPAAFTVRPFQVYGNWLAHTAWLILVTLSGFTVTVRLTIESQPKAVFRVTEKVPAPLILRPFQVYGS